MPPDSVAMAALATPALALGNAASGDAVKGADGSIGGPARVARLGQAQATMMAIGDAFD